MQRILGKKDRQKKDDTLFGLLSIYKSFGTYFRLLISEEDKFISVQMTDNPKNWPDLSDERYINARVLRRLEIGCSKLVIKYIKPVHIIKVKGTFLGIKLSAKTTKIIDHLEDKGYFILETSIKQQKKIIEGVNKILNLSSQKKYEILEKCLLENQE